MENCRNTSLMQGPRVFKDPDTMESGGFQLTLMLMYGVKDLLKKRDSL